MKIKKVHSREILDSRGIPTVETEIYLEDGGYGISSVPSGSPAGQDEAVELRDNDLTRFGGKGVLKAVTNVNNIIAPKVIGFDASYQSKLDQLLIELDGTKYKEKLGGNAILSVSQAALKASANSYKMPVYQYLMAKYQLADKTDRMPIPTFNIINGGKHGAGNLDFQEFHIIPSSQKTYKESLQCGEEIYQALKKVLIYRRAIHSVGDEGGFAPNLFTNMDALEVIMEAIKETSYEFGRDVFLGLDIAASFFYKNGQYTIKDRAQPFNTQEFIEYYKDLNEAYHAFSLEDPLEKDDWKGWVQLTGEIGQNTVIIGDDLLCTNKERVNNAVKKKACTAILVKPNQVGTITETIEVIKIAKDAGWNVVVSHRSGETNDDFIADFAVGVGSNYTKFGAPARGERIAKYNRLTKIEEELQSGNR